MARKARLIFVGWVVLFAIPWPISNPVQNAHRGDWNQNSFWAYPWGKSVVHKGIDIFAREGTPVISPTWGLVLFKGTIPRGGKVVVLLASGWRIHYFAHLSEASAVPFMPVLSGAELGKVGATGNAAGKPPHLHYTVVSLIPHPWRIDDAIDGWKKMVYLNPSELIRD